MENKPAKLPKINDLVSVDNDKILQNDLMVLLNQEPPAQWIKEHPFAKVPYLPIEKVEYLLNSIFINWRVEILTATICVNSFVTTVRLHVQNPITGDWTFHDGIGAQPLQVNSGANPTDISQLKSNAVQLAAPISKSYAIKDAADHLGRLFGRDVSRKEKQSYDSLFERFTNSEVTKKDLPK